MFLICQIAIVQVGKLAKDLNPQPGKIGDMGQQIFAGDNFQVDRGAVHMPWLG